MCCVSLQSCSCGLEPLLCITPILCICCNATCPATGRAQQIIISSLWSKHAACQCCIILICLCCSTPQAQLQEERSKAASNQSTHERGGPGADLRASWAQALGLEVGVVVMLAYACTCLLACVCVCLCALCECMYLRAGTRLRACACVCVCVRVVFPLCNTF